MSSAPALFMSSDGGGFIPTRFAWSVGRARATVCLYFADRRSAFALRAVLGYVAEFLAEFNRTYREDLGLDGR